MGTYADPYTFPFRVLTGLAGPMFGPGAAATAGTMMAGTASTGSAGTTTAAGAATCPEIEISIVNNSTKGRVTANEVNLMSKAANEMLKMYAPVWDAPAFYTKVYPKGATLKNKYQLFLIDGDDVSEVPSYGYHTKRNGQVLANISVDANLDRPNSGVLKRTKPNGGAVSQTLCHEILEMIGNPDVNRLYPAQIPVYRMENSIGELVELDPDQDTVISRTINGQAMFFIPAIVFAERCDPVQENQLTVTVEGREVEITDFIYPAWYDGADAKGPYNQKNTLPRPFSMDPGGYLNFYLENPYEAEDRFTGRYYMYRPFD
jgi:hypothetical protein